MTQMNGTSRAIRPGDMIMRDAEGIWLLDHLRAGRSLADLSRDVRVLYVAYAAPAGSDRTWSSANSGGSKRISDPVLPAVAWSSIACSPPEDRAIRYLLSECRQAD